MKRRILGAILTMTLFGTVTLLGGCATMRGGQPMAKAPTDTLQKAQTDMKQAVVQVDATTASLETLIKPDQVALQKAFDEYKDNVDKMESVANKINKNDTELRNEGREYFSELQQKEMNYTDPKLREASSERRTDMNQVYSKVPQASSNVKDSLTPYLAQLKQIQTYLTSDLTPKGIEAMRPVAQKAIQDGQALKQAAEPAISAMDRAITALTPGSTGAAAGGRQE
ncbi:DUF2959 family protein [Geobacter sp. DSM 9736]|uniref:DUF2959 family protein n=1 Tax=Geobacter sp. DSM 9736 TaxID=1277350 RepID=UPI000B50C1F8|nr:DUF2959 family protein [Geobacter sp. DSM 9736]SNB44755.1 Protein of unknown function [Geobacter sp. DSM 9736]